MLDKIFSGGATELVKSVGGVIDNLHTSKKKKLDTERKIKEKIKNEKCKWNKNNGYKKT